VSEADEQGRSLLKSRYISGSHLLRPYYLKDFHFFQGAITETGVGINDRAA